MLKIVITGPECSGKTSLAKDLAAIYNTTFVPEFARIYLNDLNRPYGKYDLFSIALGQYRSEIEALRSTSNLLICDTSLLIIKIWSQVKFGETHPSINALLDLSRPDLYILPHFDIPYETDSLRENPTDRHDLHEIYLKELASSYVNWVEIKGDRESRLRAAQNKIDSLLSSQT